MKWAKPRHGTQPASGFMLKSLVFVDLPRTRPCQIDSLGEQNRKKQRPIACFKKTSSFVLIWPRSLPRALCIPCHAFLVLSSTDLYLATGCVYCMLSLYFSVIGSWETGAGISSVLPLRCTVVALLVDGFTQKHTQTHTQTQIISFCFHNPSQK